ncbi:MAG: hypothetical protein ACE5GX_09135 [Thermoanaerobaculia bacterium]
MKKSILIGLYAALGTACLASSAAAGTLLVTDSVFKATKAQQVHPGEVFGGVVVPIRLSKAQVCVFYSNTTKKGNQGLIRTDVTIIGRKGKETKLKLNGRVKNNEFLLCKKAPTLRPGDGVTFSTRLLEMPRLRRRGKKDDDVAQIAGFVAEEFTLEDLFPEPEPPPEPVECPDPPPPPPPPPPPGPSPTPTPEPTPEPEPGGGPLTAADQKAASALLIQSTKTQLWRFKANNPRKWTVIGPRTLLGGGPGGVNPSTTGYGNSIAAAVADYEAKRGKLPAGSGLSQRDQQALVWYGKMNSGGGPTSIRRDTGGVYHGEYFRPGKGAIHRGGFTSIAAVVDWFKAQGL